MIYLRQSTASQEVPLGYFVDSTDGNTEETALSIANTDIKVWKTGATTLASKNSGGATHISNGIYYAVFDATDTDTIGPLAVFCHVAGALTVRLECCVLDEAVYDVMFGTTAPATATNITAGTITTATNLTNLPAITANWLTAAGTAADFGAEIATAIWTDTTAGDFTTALSIGKTIVNGVSLGTGLTINAYTGNTAQTGDSFARIGVAGAGLTNIDLPNQTMDIVGNITGNLSGTVGSVTGAVGSVTGNVGGNVTGSVGTVNALAANVITAASMAADASAEIADQVWDEAKAGHTTAGTYGQHFGAATESATVNDAGATTTAFITTLASAVNDHYVGRVIIFTSGTLLNQASTITDYVGATKTVTVTALTSAPADSVSFIVV